jgi:hypothetical protein
MRDEPNFAVVPIVSWGFDKPKDVTLTRTFEIDTPAGPGTLSIEAVVPSGLSQPELRRDAEGAITVVSKFAKAGTLGPPVTSSPAPSE